MARPHLLVPTLLCAVLTTGCISNNPGDDTQGGPTSTTSTTSATAGTAGDSAPTSATATTTGPGMGGTADDACSFLGCDDYPWPPCDVFAQDCPEGQKCAAYKAGGSDRWDDIQCVEVTGTDKPGEMCTAEDPVNGVDSCIKGAMCWGVSMEGIGTCVALCTGTPEAPVCEDNANCAASGDGVLNLCLPTCNPLLQDCPNPTDACYPVVDSYYFACAPNASGDAGQAGDPCQFLVACDEGLMCADAAFVGMGCAPGSLGCCTPFCNFPNGACPNPDQQCVQWFDPMEIPPNDPDLNIGVCGVPG